MPKEDRSASLHEFIQELREEAFARAMRAQKTAKQAETLAIRIKALEKEVEKKS